MMDNFMNERIEEILQFCKFFIFPEMLVIYLDLSYGDKKKWV